MKAKYLFTAFLASVALLSSCEKELDHYLDEIQVSSSYVAINVDGGSTTIDLTTVGDWKIENALEGFPSFVLFCLCRLSAGLRLLQFR